jgi:hypothetical protein
MEGQTAAALIGGVIWAFAGKERKWLTSKYGRSNYDDEKDLIDAMLS